MKEKDSIGLLITILIFLGVMTMVIGIKVGEDIKEQKRVIIMILVNLYRLLTTIR